MTVSSTTRAAGPFLGNGVTTEFPFDFKVFEAADIAVYYTDEDGTQTLLSDGYTVTLNADQDADPGGTITYPNTGSAMTADESIAAVGDLAYLQGTDLTNAGRFLPQVIENALDYVTILLQQLRESFTRVLSYPVGDTATGEIPAVALRASKYLAFDVDGNPVASTGTGADSGLRADLASDASGSGSDLVAFPDAIAPTYLKTVSDIISGNDVSLLRFIARTKHAGIRAGTNTDDHSAALVEAAQTVKALHIPYGDFTMSPALVTTPTVKRIRGDGREATRLYLTEAGVLLTLGVCNFVNLRDMTFALVGNPQSIANTYGLKFLAGSGAGNSNTERCNFLGFAQNGLWHAGTIANPMSGHIVQGCYFLGNGAEQLKSVYSHDFHIEQNQFGILGAAAHATVGALLDHCDAGTLAGNYAWQNQIGVKALTCNYNTAIKNRIEQNDHEGYYQDGGAVLVFDANKLHTNSQSGNGLYDYAYFKNIDTIAANGNMAWSWDTTYGRWAINFDSGCSNVVWDDGNKVRDGFDAGKGPVRVDSTIASSVAGNLDFVGTSGSNVAANSTVYLGVGGQNGTEAYVVILITRRCAVKRVYVASGSAPGASKNFTYTLRKNIADTAMVATISGAVATEASATVSTPQVLCQPGEFLTLRLVTDLGATATAHRFAIELLAY